MAKRGRPTVKTKNSDMYKHTYSDSAIDGMLTTGNGRSLTNAYYSTYALRAYTQLAEADPDAFTIPYWDEIQFKNCITEQLGRMMLQDRYEGNILIDVARLAAEAYHQGYTAKEITRVLRAARLSGDFSGLILDE